MVPVAVVYTRGGIVGTMCECRGDEIPCMLMLHAAFMNIQWLNCSASTVVILSYIVGKARRRTEPLRKSELGIGLRCIAVLNTCGGADCRALVLTSRCTDISMKVLQIRMFVRPEAEPHGVCTGLEFT